MSYDEKANVSIDAEGTVLKCAKALAPAECGYQKGADICGKCGAIPVEMKMIPASDADEKGVLPPGMAPEELEAAMGAMDKKPMKKPVPEAMEDEEEDEEVAEKMYGMMPKKKKKGMGMAVPMMDGEEEVEVEEDEEMEEEEKMYGMTMMPKKKKKMYGNMPMMDDEEEMEEEEEEEEEMMSPRARRRKAMGPNASVAMDEEEDEEMEDEEELEEVEDDEMEEVEDEEEVEEEDEEDEEMMGEKSFSSSDPEWENIRRQRIKSMGMKPSDLGAFGYVCVIERKAYAGSSTVCDDCPGGCVAEKGLPGILHAEGLAEKMFEGSVIDSGYSPAADMFVVDVQTKDGGVKEIFIDGTNAEVMGFHRLDISEFEQKSELASYKLIDFTEAAEIAVKSIDGTVVAVEPDVFEGFDSYAVEIEGFDGKSYDVFVALDGEILGYDRYEQDESEEIEAEAAEIALKRAFSEEKRMELAKEGMALADGSYPIVNETDLRNAIQAYGRAKDKEAAKVHIMKRARALKLESLIPGNWIAGAKEKSENINDAQFLASLVEFQLLEETL